MKRSSILGLLMVCGALVMSASETDAQGLNQGAVVQGAFGPRVLGRPLEAPPRMYIGGIRLGPTGDFVGIGRAQRGTMFGPTAPAVSVPLPPGGLLPPGLYGGLTGQLTLPTAVQQATGMGLGVSELGRGGMVVPQAGAQPPGTSSSREPALWSDEPTLWRDAGGRGISTPSAHPAGGQCDRASRSGDRVRRLEPAQWLCMTGAPRRLER